MIVNEPMPHDDCRYWYANLPLTLKGLAKREADAAIRRAGLKSSKYGMKSRKEAETFARNVEAETGVELEIGKHDYL